MDEPLPAYSPTLQHNCIVLCQHESNYHDWKGARKAALGAWKPVCLEINSTQLNLRELCHQRDEVLIKKSFEEHAFQGKNARDKIIVRAVKQSNLGKTNTGNLINWEDPAARMYSMQFSHIGVNDKIPNCLRIRVGQDQLLVKCQSSQQFASLFHSLQCASELAVPLDLKNAEVQPVAAMAPLGYYDAWADVSVTTHRQHDV